MQTKTLSLKVISVTARKPIGTKVGRDADLGAIMPILTFCALSLFVAAAVFDARERRIPNALCLGLALAGLLRLGIAVAAGVSPWLPAADLAAALAIFLLGAVAFGFGLLGGGDVKLLAAGTLWVGTPGLSAFLVATVLSGGLLALLFLGWRLVRTDRHALDTMLPYGIAIASGGLLATGGAPWT
jgi:prepilin peptidase CpaA